MANEGNLSADPRMPLGERVTRLEGAVDHLSSTVGDLKDAVEHMTSDEIAALRRRADLPRRILYAVMLPVSVAVVTAIVLSLLGSAHVI